MTQPERYRVELLLATGDWVTYTHKKGVDSAEYAQSLADHLQRNKTGWRIVELYKKQERILEEWRPESSPQQEQSTIKIISSLDQKTCQRLLGKP